MAADGVLVRFGEIGIKSAPVRRAMLERLRMNLLDLMERAGVEGDVLRLGARLWMVGPDTDRLSEVACRTFGVVSASPARLVPARLDDVCRAAAEAVMAVSGWRTFAVRARREGTHPFGSQEVNVQAGSAVFEAAAAAGRQPKVDLGHPDLEVHVDIRDDRAFVFTTHREGPGGIPMGSQGRVLALLSDEASAVAAWLAARRGCRVHLLHVGKGAAVAELVAVLARWGLPRSAESVPTPAPVTKSVLLEVAAAVARKSEAQAIVTGETLDSRLMGAPVPVLRPVCGLDPDEYRRFRDLIGLASVRTTSAPLAQHGGPGAEELLSASRSVAA